MLEKGKNATWQKGTALWKIYRPGGVFFPKTRWEYGCHWVSYRVLWGRVGRISLLKWRSSTVASCSPNTDLRISSTHSPYHIEGPGVLQVNHGAKIFHNCTNYWRHLSNVSLLQQPGTAVTSGSNETYLKIINFTLNLFVVFGQVFSLSFIVHVI